MKKIRRLLSVVLCIQMIILCGPNAKVEAAYSIVVDCNRVIREVTHCASGSLYGVTESIPADVNSLIAPLKPYVLRNPGRGSYGNQHPFGDALLVARRLSSVPSARVSVDLADILPNWPYTWPGMSSWLNQVRSFIQDKLASGCNNIYGYEIWNEPDGTWKSSNGSFYDLWLQTYRLIRANDPSAKIIGPCDSYYKHNDMQNFLNFCKQNNCLPDIMSWHELIGIEHVAGHMRDYRELEKALGIPELPLSINEYCDANHSLEGQPGSCAQFIGKFERYKVDSACISWWFVPNPGRLGRLLATDTQKGAGWYLFQWYGEMAGKMVAVTPPNDSSNLVDGAACVDDNAKCVSFIFGGHNDGTIQADIKNLPSFIGSKARVKVEKIDWVSKDTVSNGPTVVFTQEYDVVNGRINVTVPYCNNDSGYRIYITKGDGTLPPPTPIPTPTPIPETKIISGHTYKLINRNSGLALDVYENQKENGANVIQWSDNGGNNQKWTIIAVNGGYKLINVNSQKALDVDHSSKADGGNVLQWQDNGQNNQKWQLISTGDGYYQLVNVNSGKLLDVSKGSTQNGGDVIQWSSNGGYNQQWRIIEVN